MVLIAILRVLDAVSVSSVPTPVVLAIVGFLTTALGVLGTLQYVRSRSAGGDSPGADALLERNEGAWQERVNFMLKGLSDTIGEGYAAHREELHEIGRTMRDQTQALRAAVDEMVAQRKDFAAYTVRGVAAMTKVDDLHQRLVTIPWRRPPKSKTKSRSSRRRRT